MNTVTITQALADMAVRLGGPPPRVGWLAAVKDGKVYMVAGKPAEHIFRMNCEDREHEGITICKIVAG